MFLSSFTKAQAWYAFDRSAPPVHEESEEDENGRYAASNMAIAPESSIEGFGVENERASNIV